jgi:hypothetical protein
MGDGSNQMVLPCGNCPRDGCHPPELGPHSLRHLSLVPGRLRTSKSVPRSMSAQLLANLRNWLISRRFTAVWLGRTQTVGAILLWLLGIPIPIIILLLLLWH